METKRLQSKAGILGVQPSCSTQTLFQKWGNSLGVRIPCSLAKQIGLAAGSAVSLSAKNSELVVKPAVPTRLSLDELLAAVSDSNLHSSVETGSAVRAEIF
jgi:antitoxin MazE